MCFLVCAVVVEGVLFGCNKCVGSVCDVLRDVVCSLCVFCVRGSFYVCV